MTRPSQRRHAPTIKAPVCPVCGGPVTQNKRGTAYYCSAACKQKAWRQAHSESLGDTPLFREQARKQHYQRVVGTKSMNEYMVTCSECGKMVVTNQLHAAQQYCSAACKQKAYRRRVNQEKEYAAMLQTVTLDTWDDLPGALKWLGAHYFARHDCAWNFDQHTIEIQGRECYLSTPYGDRFWLSNPTRAKEFLVRYVIKGWPNAAMLRQK